MCIALWGNTSLHGEICLWDVATRCSARGGQRRACPVPTVYHECLARFLCRSYSAARPHPRLRPGEGEGSAGRKSALRAVGGRPVNPPRAPRQRRENPLRAKTNFISRFNAIWVV